MAQTTVNPYEEIGQLVSGSGQGLDTIISALPSGATIDLLVNAVAQFIETTFYPSPTTQVDIEIKSVARTAINSYVNNLVMGGQAGYNAKQFRFIEMLMGNSLTSNLPLISINNRIGDVNDNLTDNQLTVEEQTPLLLATTIGGNADSYWNNVIATLGSSGWKVYIVGQLQVLGVDVPYYDAAAMNGALAGYAATPSGMIEPSVNFVTNKMVSALIGALTVTAGKVIFGWIPRIQHGNNNSGQMMMGPNALNFVNASAAGNPIKHIEPSDTISYYHYNAVWCVGILTYTNGNQVYWMQLNGTGGDNT
jgi:hypothetical protein